ncbi:hypothetical protein QN277_024107 [Acacia crassicarpa]|uniref:RPW8 domain-containing protein n=1 Tax=Acacia crassicarpa TaxID=499986 RepID=A0AAE1MJ68_9FABA|nr:hypothetical protein QN277_024107 [Acacia crassicarpa]
MADPSTILELAEKISDITGRGMEYKSTRELLESTNKDLGPLLEQIRQYTEENDLPTDEIEKLRKVMEANKEVLDKCKIRRWNFWLAPYFQRKLDEEYQAIQRYCSVQMQTQIARDLKRVLSKLSSDDDDRNSLRSESISSRESKRIRTQTFKGDLEIFPEFTVGLDGPFMKEVKTKLLHGDDQVLNLYGLAGSGKTTLAKKLCHDPQVKDKFKNIFFVTLGSQFRGDEAINDLQDRLPEVGANLVLLVLDDVWPASEKIVEEFRVQMSAGSKIFVTSRVPVTKLGIRFPMEQLSEDDAVALFLHFVQQSNIDFDNREIRKILLQIVKGCKCLPLALEFIGRELRDKGIEELQKVQLEWSRGHSILDWNSKLLGHLQNSLDLLVDESVRECFMDLALFPEDQKIPVSALIDIWTELHNLDEQGIYAMTFIHKLTELNLAAGIIVRIVRRDVDNYYNNHFLVQHDLFRELAIRISNQEPFENRKRLIIDMNGNHRPDWWPQQQQLQQVSYFTKWFMDPNQKRVSAPILSISTDQNINPDWCNIQADKATVMVLNLKTTKYTLPEFIKKMRNLRVLMVTNYGFRATKLKSFGFLESLWTLRRIRLQGVSVPSLCRLKNVCKLSLYMCEVNRAFEDSSIEFSEAMPNLVDLNIEYCKDLVKLPAGLCDTVTLKKLSISHCHKFTELPQEIGNLENLELLRISYCADLEEIPRSITKLRNLLFLDISYCVSLRKLPDNIGKLRRLRKFYMPNCYRISELPDSIKYMKHLESVICDEDTYPFWELFKIIHSGLNIKIVMDIGLDWLLDFGPPGLFR